MNKVYLSLGTNIGNREQHLADAIQKIRIVIGSIIAQSSIIETKPWGVENQENFLNMVICVHTTLEPQRLLQSIHQIEKDLGRIRHQKWEARIIDIDIIFYNDEIVHTEHLQIPHPLMHQRQFVLEPLAEIAAKFMHPIFKKNIEQLLDDLSIE